MSDVRRAYAELCHALFAYPSWRLGLVGVTGTNGKTTTTWLTRSMLQHAGHPTGLLGTIEYSDSVDSARSIADDARFHTVRHLAVSTGRPAGHASPRWNCRVTPSNNVAAAARMLDVAVVTNITQDHFDYHGTFDAYRAAKVRRS